MGIVEFREKFDLMELRVRALEGASTREGVMRTVVNDLLRRVTALETAALASHPGRRLKKFNAREWAFSRTPVDFGKGIYVWAISLGDDWIPAEVQEEFTTDAWGSQLQAREHLQQAAERAYAKGWRL